MVTTAPSSFTGQGLEDFYHCRCDFSQRPALACLSAPPLTPAFCLLSQKILTMIPTEEEKQKIQEAQLANPDVPLGSAEQFLLTLSSISELSARLQLWAFKMDYEIVEKVRGKRGDGVETLARLCFIFP